MAMHITMANPSGNPYRAPANAFVLRGDAVIDLDSKLKEIEDSEVRAWIKADVIAKINGGKLVITDEAEHEPTFLPELPGTFKPDEPPWRKNPGEGVAQPRPEEEANQKWVEINGGKVKKVEAPRKLSEKVKA